MVRQPETAPLDRDDERKASPLPPDEVRRRMLRRNRMMATGLLGVMGAVYAGSFLVPEPGFATHLIRAGAEAGLVGGLADWFAVTALFRRPLGLPIPHTAIIPANKERLGQALSRFVEQNFLTRALVIRKLREARLGQALARWLASPATAGAIADWAVAVIPAVIRAAEDPQWRRFASEALNSTIRDTDMAPALARLLRAFFRTREANALFDALVEQGLIWLEENKPRVHTLVRERSRWWVPKGLDRHIATAMLDALSELFQDLKDPDGEARHKLRASMEQFFTELGESPERRAQINEAKARLMDNADLRAWLASIWGEATRSALADLQKPSPALRRATEAAISSIGHTLARDEAMIAHLDAAAERIALALVLRRGEITAVMADIVRNWDTRTLTDRIELAVGSDLQYIRMSGTLVGASVGCALFLLTRAFGLEG